MWKVEIYYEGSLRVDTECPTYELAEDLMRAWGLHFEYQEPKKVDERWELEETWHGEDERLWKGTITYPR
jgi:hypothetical protein